MTDMTMVSNLSQAWRRAVAAGKVCVEFPLEAAIAGVGESGETIVAGVRLADGRCEFFARNRTTGHEIAQPTLEKPLPGTDFSVRFNRGRAWRPGAKRRQPGRQPEISSAWYDCRFDCQVATGPNSGNSLLARDPLARVELPNSYWHGYYNAFPIEAAGHFLWVPVRPLGAIPHHPQRLTHSFLEDALALAKMSANTLFFYNSLHAGASVNHIHLQSLAISQKLALERAIARGGLTWYGSAGIPDSYPATALVFRQDAGVDDIFPFVDRLQARTEPIPFNLACLPEGVCLLPRNIESEVLVELPGDVFGAMEMLGMPVVSSRANYDFFDAAPQVLTALYERASLPRSQLLALLELEKTPSSG